MGKTRGKKERKFSPPLPVFGFAENRKGWGLHVILNPWVSPMAIIVTPFQGEDENNNPEKFRGDASHRENSFTKKRF